MDTNGFQGSPLRFLQRKNVIQTVRESNPFLVFVSFKNYNIWLPWLLS